jgi:hypothetical protein
MAGDGYHRDVSNPQFQPQPSGPPPWPPAPTKSGRSPLLLVIAALAIAFIALGVAVGSWFRPAPANKPSPGPAYTSQQVAAAKTAVCAAYQQVSKAGDVAGSRNGGSDPTSILTVATSTRQVLDVSSRYLITKLDKEPATPPDLAAAVRKLANVYQEMTVDYLDGLSNSDPELSPLLQAGDEAHSTIEGLCK